MRSAHDRNSALTRSRMAEVRATLQMREMMETLCVHDTRANPENAAISDCTSSSISSRSQILLHGMPATPPTSAQAEALAQGAVQLLPATLGCMPCPRLAVQDRQCVAAPTRWMRQWRADPWVMLKQSLIVKGVEWRTPGRG